MNLPTSSADSLDQELLDILKKMNDLGKTYVVGGHLRNLFYGVKETDIDFLTLLTLEQLKSLFPRLTFTERGLDFGVCRTLYKSRQFDFSLCSSEEEFEEKLKLRDFTLNCLYSDGERIFYPGDARTHLEQRLLVPAYSLEKHFVHSDKMLVRVYRLVSEFGFEIDSETLAFLQNQKNQLTELDPSMYMDEIYRVLKSDFILKGFHLLWRVYMPDQPNVTLADNQDLKIPMIGENIKGRLIYLDSLLSDETLPRLLSLLQIDERFAVDFNEARAVLGNTLPAPSKSIPLYLLVKRYQTNDDPIELAKFLASLTKKK